LTASVVNITHPLTEEGERFTSLKGKTRSFAASFIGMATNGQPDELRVHGSFEVVGIDPAQWERFESKDFGYRRNSTVWTADRLRSLEQEAGTSVPQELEVLRKSRAVEAELEEIGKRLTSRITNLGRGERGTAFHQPIRSDMLGLDKEVRGALVIDIEQEFGVRIAFREFECRESALEELHAEVQQEVRTKYLEQAKADLAHSTELMALANQQQREFLQSLFERRKEVLEMLSGEARQEKLAEIDNLIAKTMANQELKVLSRDDVLQARTFSLLPGALKPSLDAPPPAADAG